MKREKTGPLRSGFKITENTILAEILKIKGAEKILSEFGVPCLHCPMAAYEMDKLKIGDVAKTYGLDIIKLLKKLNKLK